MKSNPGASWFQLPAAPGAAQRAMIRGGLHLLGKYLWERGKRSKDDVMELESDALEEYLIKLASDKGAIDSNLMKSLRDAKKRNDDYRKLSYGK